MAIYFNPGDDFAQRRVLAKKIEEKPEENINDNNENPPSSTSTNNNDKLERVIENSADIILGNINRVLLNRRPFRPLPPQSPVAPTPQPIVTSDDEKSAEVGFESYTALRNYVFSGASADFNKTYTDITFRGGCQAADNVAKRHVDDFASVSKEDLLKELYDEYTNPTQNTNNTQNTQNTQNTTNSDKPYPDNFSGKFQNMGELQTYVHKSEVKDYIFAQLKTNISDSDFGRIAYEVAMKHSNDLSNVTVDSILSELIDAIKGKQVISSFEELSQYIQSDNYKNDILAELSMTEDDFCCFANESLDDFSQKVVEKYKENLNKLTPKEFIQEVITEFHKFLEEFVAPSYRTARNMAITRAAASANPKPYTWIDEDGNKKTQEKDSIKDEDGNTQEITRTITTEPNTKEVIEIEERIDVRDPSGNVLYTSKWTNDNEISRDTYKYIDNNTYEVDSWDFDDGVRNSSSSTYKKVEDGEDIIISEEGIEDGQACSKEYNYDEKNNLISVVKKKSDNTNNTKVKEVYDHDQKTLLSKTVYDSNDNLLSFSEYTYHSWNDRTTEKITYYSDQSSDEITTWKDYPGDCEITHRDAAGNVLWEKIVEINEDTKNITTEIKEYQNDEVCHSQETIVDEDGNLLQETNTQYKNEGGVQYQEAETTIYNEDGSINAISETITVVNEDGSRVVKEYDSNNNLITYQEYDKDGDLVINKHDPNGINDVQQPSSDDVTNNQNDVSGDNNGDTSTDDIEKTTANSDGNTVETTYHDGYTSTITKDQDGKIVQKVVEETNGTVTTTTFDKLGNIKTETIKEPNGNKTETTYSDDGSSSSVTTDKNGTLVKDIVITSDGNRTETTYGDNGSTSSVTKDKNNKLISSRVIQCDNNHTVISDITTRYGDNGLILVTRTTYNGSYKSSITTDNNGKVVQSRTEESNGTVTTINFDEHGNPINEITVDANNNKTETNYENGYTETTRYDANGHLTEKTIVEVSKNSTTTTVTKYGDDAKAISETITVVNEDGSKVVKEYDSNNNLITYQEYDKTGDLVRNQHNLNGINDIQQPSSDDVTNNQNNVSGDNNGDTATDDIGKVLDELGLSETEKWALTINGSLTKGDMKITLVDGQLHIENINGSTNNQNDVSGDNNGDTATDDIGKILDELGLSETDKWALTINGSLTKGDMKITLVDGQLNIENIKGEDVSQEDIGKMLDDLGLSDTDKWALTINGSLTKGDMKITLVDGQLNIENINDSNNDNVNNNVNNNPTNNNPSPSDVDWAKEDTIKSDNGTVTTITYDKNGNVISTTVTDPDGNSTTVWGPAKDNPENQNLDNMMLNYSTTKKITTGTETKEYKNGKLVSTTRKDKNGKITQITLYREDGQYPAYIQNYTYDAKGNVTMSNQIEFNQGGQIAVQTVTDQWGGTSTTEYTYDSNRQRTGYKETNIDADGNKGYITYDAKGNVVSAEFDVINNKGAYVHINPSDFVNSKGEINHQKVIEFAQANGLSTTYTGSVAIEFFTDLQNANATGNLADWWAKVKSGQITYNNSSSSGSTGYTNNSGHGNVWTGNVTNYQGGSGYQNFDSYGNGQWVSHNDWTWAPGQAGSINVGGGGGGGRGGAGLYY